jgi:hypothetical protein
MYQKKLPQVERRSFLYSIPRGQQIVLSGSFVLLFTAGFSLE